MNYDFTSYVNRDNTGAVKWELMHQLNPNVDEGVLPLSVADMEFKSAPEIYEGLIDYLKTAPILGYTSAPEDYLEAIVNWQEKRHNWIVEKEWIISTPNVVAAMHAAIQAFSNKGDGVIIFQPVYKPFSETIQGNNRVVSNVSLIEKDGYYTIDFEQFEKAAKKPENKILLFCSPHNPVGRVWYQEELERLANIALQNDLIVLSDEIWNDLVHPKQNHTVLHQVNKDLQDRLVIFTSASKTFNLAGIAAANTFISNKEMREKFLDALQKSHLTGVNHLGFEAVRLAYTHGEKWLDELNKVVYSNQTMVKQFFKGNEPRIKAPISEGTYVQWLDFRALNLEDKERSELLIEAQFFTNPGSMFGVEGIGFERINVAMPEASLKDLLNRLLDTLQKQD